MLIIFSSVPPPNSSWSMTGTLQFCRPRFLPCRLPPFPRPPRRTWWVSWHPWLSMLWENASSRPKRFVVVCSIDYGFLFSAINHFWFQESSSSAEIQPARPVPVSLFTIFVFRDVFFEMTTFSSKRKTWTAPEVRGTLLVFGYVLILVFFRFNALKTMGDLGMIFFITLTLFFHLK